MHLSSVVLNSEECSLLTQHTVNYLAAPPLNLPVCVLDFPNPFSSGSSSAPQQPAALSPSNPFSSASGGEIHAPRPSHELFHGSRLSYSVTSYYFCLISKYIRPSFCFIFQNMFSFFVSGISSAEGNILDTAHKTSQ